MEAYSHFQIMLRVMMEVLLIGLAGIFSLAENLRLEDVTGSSIPLEHRMIDHVPQIYQR